MKDELTVKIEDGVAFYKNDDGDWQPLDSSRLGSRLKIDSSGPPTDDQLEKINKFIPKGFPHLSKDEVISVSVVAADNLVNRGYGAWDVEALKKMSDLIIGKPALINHDHYDVRSQWGRIYDAQFVKVPTPDSEFLSRAGFGDVNEKIINDRGFYRVFIQAFTNADHDIVKALKYSQVGEVSTGGFRFKNYICGDCKVSFTDKKCPHYIPTPWDNGTEEHASHYIRANLTDILECSFVSNPNLPGAGVVYN